MVLKFYKKCIFCTFCTDLSRKSNCVKGIYIYTFKRSRYAFSENGNCLLCYYLLFWRYEVLKSNSFIKFLLSQHIFYFLIADILWTVAQTPINHIICWRTAIRTFRSNMCSTHLRSGPYFTEMLFSWIYICFSLRKARFRQNII